MRSNNLNQSLRIDKWLWAARFFRTRTLASTAVNGGKVHVNSERVKSSRLARVGDELEINRRRLQITVVVIAISAKRGPASEAEKLYTETPASRVRRESEVEQTQLFNASISFGSGRPSKRDRRRLRHLSGKT